VFSALEADHVDGHRSDVKLALRRVLWRPSLFESEAEEICDDHNLK
jgi:hypothetical protein